MANVYLKPIYEKIYRESFSYDDFNKRMKMQKAIYLLQELGVPIGDYAFFWYKHGPYSQDLQDAMYASHYFSDSSEEIHFSPDTLSAINRLSDLLNEKVKYSPEHWAECVASIHYLQTSIFSPSTSDDDIVRELMKRKPHLRNFDLNIQALHEVSALCA